MSEQKLFYTVCATLLMYGLGSFMQLGSFILPIPFFESGLLLICCFLAVKIWIESKILSVMFLFYGLFQFFGLEYNYSFFLSDENLTSLSSSLITDIFKITAHISLLGILYFQNLNSTIISSRSLFGIYSAILLFTIFIPGPFWIIIPIVLILEKAIRKEILFQKTYSFWLYLPLFILARELSLYFL